VILGQWRHNLGNFQLASKKRNDYNLPPDVQ
jgi:hypothetical protein